MFSHFCPRTHWEKGTCQRGQASSNRLIRAGEDGRRQSDSLESEDAEGMAARLPAGVTTSVEGFGYFAFVSLPLAAVGRSFAWLDRHRLARGPQPRRREGGDVYKDAMVMTTTSAHLQQQLSELTVPGVLLENRLDGRLSCTACAHRCAVSDGAAGLCRVRHREGSELRVPFSMSPPGVSCPSSATPSTT